MSDTLSASLSSTLKRSTLEQVAKQLGESDQAVSRGFDWATSSVFGSLASKAQDSSMLRQVIDVATKTPADVASRAVIEGHLTNPTSPLIAGGERFLSMLFGAGRDPTLSSMSRESGLRTGSAATIFALGAQSVLSVIGNRVRNEGMTPTGLSSLLQSEGPSFRSSAPAGFHETVATASTGFLANNPVVAQRIETNPVVAQALRKPQSVLPWVLPLLAAVLGLLWFGLRHRQPTVGNVPVSTATVANLPTLADLGNFVTRPLSSGVTLNIPERGIEGRLLAFIQDSNRTPDKTTWFDFDRLLFDTGSATLRPESQEQLHNVAEIMKAYPNVNLKIGGYTDNVGLPADNLKLSQDRASNVMAELVGLGIAPNRLAAEGYGEDHPVADNSTESGRALNRRISTLVTQK